MNKEGKMQNIVMILLAVAVVGMSVGFAVAAFNQTLNITGNVTANKAVWDVHFTNFAEKTGTGYVAEKGAIDTTDDTKVTYTVALNPGEKYGFTVDAKNFGTLEAKLVSITLGGDTISTAEAAFLKYTVKVDGTAYTASATGLTKTLAANAVHTVDVEVEYVIPSDPDALPSTDVTKKFTIALGYESTLQNAN